MRLLAVVTAPCRDARSVRPLCQRVQHRGFNEDGRTTVRPYKGLLVSLTSNL